jgi:hypothetical protein
MNQGLGRVSRDPATCDVFARENDKNYVRTHSNRFSGARAGADAPIEARLPVEVQPDYFHSLPIAGRIVTPDEVALRVMTNPRLRVTAGLPYSGKGMAYPIHQSGAADTRADPFSLTTTSSVRGADRPPNP